MMEAPTTHQPQGDQYLSVAASLSRIAGPGGAPALDARAFAQGR
jgi:hypothetical protein